MTLIRYLLAGLMAVTVAACSREAGDPKVVRVGLPGSGTSARMAPSGAWGVAERKGFLQEEFGKDGVRFEFVYLPGNGVALNEALASRQLDFATYGGLPNVIGLAGGNPARVIVVNRSMNAFYLGVHPDSPIRTVADLKGRKITVQKGNISHHRLVLWLKAHGLGENEVELVSLASPEGNAAFAARQVDAVWSGFPVLVMRDKGLVRVVGSTDDGISDDEAIGLAGLMVSKPFEDSHPELVGRVTKVLLKSYAWMSRDENRDEYIRLESSATGYPAVYYEQELTGPLKARFNPTMDGRVEDGFRQIISFAREQKLIRNTPSLEGWFAREYQAAALKELGLQSYWAPALARSDEAVSGSQ